MHYSYLAFTRPKPVLNPSKPYYEESANNAC